MLAMLGFGQERVEWLPPQQIYERMKQTKKTRSK
jgi:hypothetical protein